VQGLDHGGLQIRAAVRCSLASTSLPAEVLSDPPGCVGQGNADRDTFALGVNHCGGEQMPNALVVTGGQADGQLSG
jgi:hypothetical protein